ncbi:hypothetical protein V6245_00640 [Salinibacterium amurskyense]|uniref:hypothetical protein n=1 Tax=Salinibacterium amurskyense TaxID=205941 RepID=UPI00311ED70D
MSDEIELISDGEGMAVVGKKSVVERFLRERGLLALSENLDIERLGAFAQVADSVISGASEFATQSGRWIKLTEDSAELVKEFGLMETKTRGVSHLMIGDPGSVSKWIQAETGVGALLTNPAALAGVAGVMAQFARQQEIRELKAYLRQIDGKVSEVLRAQKDAELSKLAGARFSIDRAMSVRAEQHDRIDSVTWSTVQDRVGTMDDLMSWAIIGLKRVAERQDGAETSRERTRLAQQAESEVAEMLAVIASCFELQDSLDVMRLDRVLEESPGTLDHHRSALNNHRLERRSSIMEATGHLVARIDAAAMTANSHAVLHVNAADKVTCVANVIGEMIAQFSEPLGLETSRAGMQSPRWMDAIRSGEQLKSAGKEAGPKLIVPGLIVVGVGLYLVPATRPIAIKTFEAARSAFRGPV